MHTCEDDTDDDDTGRKDNYYIQNVTGPANEEVLLQWLMQCREPSVQHLTDSTFEHLTQVIFHHDDDDDRGLYASLLKEKPL